MTFTPRTLSSNSAGSDGLRSPRSPKSQTAGITIRPRGIPIKSGTSTLTNMSNIPNSSRYKDKNPEIAKIPLRVSVDMFQAHMRNDNQ